MSARSVAIAAAAFALAGSAASAEPPRATHASTTYHRRTVDGVSVFYREAGPPDAPVILLLHGFPTSSRMFDTLIPLLADRYHLIAPDYVGFGQSDAPPADKAIVGSEILVSGVIAHCEVINKTGPQLNIDLQQSKFEEP